jgi:hypothetical protein
MKRSDIMSVIKPETNINQLKKSYFKNMNIYNNLKGKEKYDGMNDKFSEIRLRLAIVDNPEIKRNKYEKIDELDEKNIFNYNTGKLTLKWLNMPGGVIRPHKMGGGWKYIKENDYEKPEERDFSEWEIQSRREMVSLTHPFIWADDENYCGLNYVPPVGSVVVVGFRKHGFPIILGYLQTHYNICYPPLKPGEMTMKGYGNNYIHWRWSDKLDTKVWTKRDKVDLDDPDREKISDTNVTMWLRMNAHDRNIKMSVFETDPPEDSEGKEVEKGEGQHRIHGTHKTEMIMTPKNLEINSLEIEDKFSNDHQNKRNTRIFQDEQKVIIETNNPGKYQWSRREQQASFIDEKIVKIHDIADEEEDDREYTKHTERNDNKMNSGSEVKKQANLRSPKVELDENGNIKNIKTDDNDLTKINEFHKDFENYELTITELLDAENDYKKITNHKQNQDRIERKVEILNENEDKITEHFQDKENINKIVTDHKDDGDKITHYKQNQDRVEKKINNKIDTKVSTYLQDKDKIKTTVDHEDGKKITERTQKSNQVKQKVKTDEGNTTRTQDPIQLKEEITDGSDTTTITSTPTEFKVETTDFTVINKGNTSYETEGNTDFKVKGNTKIDSKGNHTFKAGGNTDIKTGGNSKISTGGNHTEVASKIFLN